MTVGFYIELEARADTVEEVAALVAGSRASAERDGDMVAWFGARTGPTSFLMFNTFVDADARAAHAAGEDAAAAAARAAPLLAVPPRIVEHEVIAQKLPAGFAAR